MKLLLVAIITAVFLILTSSVSALNCTQEPDKSTRVECKFGTISPPPQLVPFTSPDPTGAGGISKFLTNLVGLIYSLAAVVLIFMLLWGAFDWMTSGGEKEKLESARNKIISAIIGIMLFAVAFAVIKVLGQFTGFEFFSGQTRPGVSQRRQPDTPCAIEYRTCLNQAGGPDVVIPPNEQSKCLDTYEECVRTTP